MKNLSSFLLISMLIQISVLFALQPSIAPLNPEFVKYMNQKQTENWQNKIEDGNTLGYIPQPIKYITNSKIGNSTRKLPTIYDLRDVGGTNYVSPVKSQASCGCCWAFAAYGNIEGRILFQNEGLWDFSENNLKQNHGFALAPCDGGNAGMSSAYFLRGEGIILESDDPYLDYDSDNWNGNPPVMYNYDAFYLPRDKAIIQQAIYDYGAIYTNMCWSDPSYNSSNNTYYYSGAESTNHAVTLVGWDDTKSTDGGTGVWIIKNSWGASWGESGYFYISYNDTKVNNEVCYWPETIDYNADREINYYDKLGSLGSVGYGINTGYALVKFIPATNHAITKLSTNAVVDGTTIGFEVYDTYSGGALSNLLGTIPNQVVTRSGYKTLDLTTPIEVTAGNDIYVKIYYNTPSYNYPIPFEQEIANYAYPTIETGVFWISSNGSNGSWLQLGGGTGNLWDPVVKTYGVPQNLESPQNVTSTTTTTNVILSWDAVLGATDYVVYSADDPYGTYTIDNSGILIGTQWTSINTNLKKFYYIIATNGAAKIYNQLKVSHK